jgi:energy-coupling factor transporter transmembrane protein EcfT
MYLDRLEYKKDILLPVDGRCRFISAAFLIVSAVYTTSAPTLAGLILLCLPPLARELRVTFLRLIPVNMMTAALWLPALAGLGSERALLYTLRINAAALLCMVFIIPMSVSVIASAMMMLRIPKKLVSLFILTYRYIFLMNDHLSTALTAMRLRCPGGGTARLWRSFAAVFASAMSAAIFRSEKISWAMASRGFNGTFPVTNTFRWRRLDSTALALSIAVSALLIFNELNGAVYS